MFYSDITSKVTDLFEKGYAYKAPFTFKVDIKDKYFMNVSPRHKWSQFVQKTEFASSEKGLNLGWEYKFKYDRDGKMASFLGAPSKVELEGEYLPKALRTENGFAKFRAKNTIGPNPHPEADAESKLPAFMKNWNYDTELETKFSFDKSIGHSLKFAFAPRHCIPKVNFTTMFDHKPLLMGVNYTFNHEAQKMTDSLEVLLGARPYKQIMTYLKHTTKGFVYPGALAVGFHGSKTFECESEKKTKDGVVPMIWKCPTELAAEASLDLADCSKYGGKVATKVGCGKKFGFQTMFSTDFNLTSAFTYTPKRGFKLIWSDQIDTKKLFTDTKLGLGYKYGFTLELGIGSF